jgi:putative glutamine amidotransferase
VIARSEDGSIEAIRHTSLLWEGWMWHPEREETFASHDIRRLKMLFGE